MNKTKKITQGAMLLAIFGAMCGIDYMLGHLLDVFVSMIVPVIIIIYAAMNTNKDGIFLALGIIIINLIINGLDITYIVYVTIGVIVGISYGIGFNANLDKKSLLIISIVSFTFGELVSFFVINPLLGSTLSVMVNAYLEELKMTMNLAGMGQMLDKNPLFGANSTSFIITIMTISVVLTGVLEGVLIHFVSVVLLKRFKIKDFGSLQNSALLKPNKIVAYVSMAMMMFFMFGERFVDFSINPDLFYALKAICLIGYFMLIRYGYIFVLNYYVIVLHRKPSILIVLLLVLFLSSFLAILGFLFAAGPLQNYLTKIATYYLNQNNNNNNNNHE